MKHAYKDCIIYSIYPSMENNRHCKTEKEQVPFWMVRHPKDYPRALVHHWLPRAPLDLIEPVPDFAKLQGHNTFSDVSHDIIHINVGVSSFNKKVIYID
jgi:hypothetical protein